MDVSGLSRSGAYVPAQRLQAQRAAAAADSRADRLASESESARNEARQLNQQAQRLDNDSRQARSEATQARSSSDGTPATTSLGRSLPAQLPQALRAADPSSTASAPKGPPVDLPARIDSLQLYLSVGAGSAGAATGGQLKTSA